MLKADAPKQFRANPIGYAVDDLSAILRRVDVGPKRPLAEGHVDDVDDRFRNFAGIGVSGLQ